MLGRERDQRFRRYGRRSVVVMLAVRGVIEKGLKLVLEFGLCSAKVLVHHVRVWRSTGLVEEKKGGKVREAVMDLL